MDPKIGLQANDFLKIMSKMYYIWNLLYKLQQRILCQIQGPLTFKKCLGKWVNFTHWVLVAVLWVV